MRHRCAVLGDPVEHSLSPVLHRAGYAALGLTAYSYERVRVPAGTLAAFLDSLDGSWRGLSLTMPLKRELVALLPAAALSPTARLAGAANTLVRSPDGSSSADNTDVPGLAAALRERSEGPLGTAVVLGGGATAASAGLALLGLGCRSITLLVRSPDRAADTRRVLAGHPGTATVTVSPLETDLPVPDVVVSTVPVAAQTPGLVARWSAAPLVADVVYDPWPTPLAAAALAAGRPVVTGLDLLAHQATLQFAQFTGREVPVDVLRDAGRAALAR